MIDMTTIVMTYRFSMIDQEKDTIAILLHDVARQLRVLIDARVEVYSLTRLKWLTLAILDRDGSISQAELAEKLDIDRSGVGRLLDRMEDRELITRVRDDHDRRVVRVSINQNVRPLLTQLEQISNQVKDIAVSGISEAEQTELIRLLKKINSNLKSQ